METIIIIILILAVVIFGINKTRKRNVGQGNGISPITPKEDRPEEKKPY